MRKFRLSFIILSMVLHFVCRLSYGQEIPQTKEDYSKKLLWLPIGYYTPETKVAAGLLLIKNLWKEKEGHTSNIMGMASVTMNGQSMMSLSPRFYFDQGGWDLSGTLFYSYYPNRYFGRGVGNSLGSPEKYTENALLMAVNSGRRLFSHLYLRGGVHRDQRRISKFESGGLIQTELQQLPADLEVLSAQVGLEWDERDFPQAPRQGALYRVSQSFYDPKDREGSLELARFRKIDFDFRQYLGLAPRWIGALQWLASEVQGDRVPFQYLNSLGGGSRMRGYYAGQVRDKSLGLVQAELRYEWNDKWTSAAFVGIARMATKISELNSADSFHSGGLGVHYILDPENRTKLRLDVGFTGKETGAYFVLGEAF